MSINALKIRSVLIARPRKQAEGLAAALKKYGIMSFIYPVIEIDPILADPEKTLRETIQAGDWLVFTSSNAVWTILPALLTLPKQRRDLRFIAIGQATQDALISAGLPKPFVPAADFSSEGLLAEPWMQECRGKRIIILGGAGGRTVLADTLTQRHAVIIKLAVYQRLPGVSPSPETIASWQDPGIDVVISTSAEGLCRLVDLVSRTGQRNREWLLNQQLLLISQRLIPAAAKKGFLKKALIAPEASQAGLISVLQDLT